MDREGWGALFEGEESGSQFFRFKPEERGQVVMRRAGSGWLIGNEAGAEPQKQRGDRHVEGGTVGGREKEREFQEGSGETHAVMEKEK